VARAVAPGILEIVISGKQYYLSGDVNHFRLTGFDPKRRAVTVYDLPADLRACDCPDHVFRYGCRPNGCKHRAALAALHRAGQLPAPAELEHARFFGDHSDLGDEQEHAAEQARLLDARAAALERFADAVTDDDVPF
jgi:hypothetical protein